MNVDLPDGLHMEFESDEDWYEQAANLTKVWSHIQWWMGDLLNNAPSTEALADLHWSTPMMEPLETAQVRQVAASFQTVRRRQVPWSYHQRVEAALLPTELQDYLLDTCSTLDLRWMHLQEMITNYLKDQRNRELIKDRNEDRLNKEEKK